MGMSMIINLVINARAYLQSAGGIGMIIGGLVLGVWGGFKNKVVTALSALIISGLFVVLFGFIPGPMLLLAIAAFFLFSAMNSMANGTFFATMQGAILHEMQGRVFTLLMSFSALMAPVGARVTNDDQALADEIAPNVPGLGAPGAPSQ